MTSKKREGRWCQHCGGTKDLRVCSSTKTRKSYMCRACNTIRCRAYRATPEGHRRANEAASRWREKNLKPAAEDNKSEAWDARARASRVRIMQRSRP